MNENTGGSKTAINPNQKLRVTGNLLREDFDGGPISLDEIDPGLYLGKMTLHLCKSCFLFEIFFRKLNRCYAYGNIENI